MTHPPSTGTPPEAIATLKRAMAAHQAGNVAEAEQLYRQVLAAAPAQFDALHLLGVIHLQRNDFAEADRLIGRALAVNAKFADAHADRGFALEQLGRPDEAIASYDQAIALDPGYAAPHSGRGNALQALARFDEAVASYDQALAREPSDPVTHSNRGNALFKLKRFEEALVGYDRALQLKPDYAECWSNRSNALLELGRHKEALASCDKAVAIRPQYAVAHSNRGTALLRQKRHDEALASYDRALALRPDLADAHFGRGLVQEEQKQFDAALVSYQQALATKPDDAELHAHRGGVLLALGRHDEALAAYDCAFALRPSSAALRNLRLFTRMHVCDWHDFLTERDQLIADVRADMRMVEPFVFLALSSTAADQLVCAREFADGEMPAATPALWRGERYSHDRIRVAYLSADFHEHATALLAAGLFEQHDRSRFEVTALSFGPDQESAMRARLKQAFERFVDVRAKSDDEIARLVREHEIDIAVDLKGFTTDARPKIFAQRPAPIQVSYLGFPATMGTNHIDYLIADPVMVPASEFPHYAERIVHLPDSYQVNDAKRATAGPAPTRDQAGLPLRGFVFCSFNKTYKYTPEVFDVWMRLLKDVGGGVLWLLADNSAAMRNLRREAERRGVAGERLIFAPLVGQDEHLARHRLADLFLDTLPCNAHTTASDALWAGLPVLTCLGTTFAGRVAGSLLHAAGLPELVTSSLADYEALALRLAREPAELAAIRTKLARNRSTCPLFDTRRFTRHIEAAYTKMWERHQRGEEPAHFAIEPIG